MTINPIFFKQEMIMGLIQKIADESMVALKERSLTKAQALLLGSLSVDKPIKVSELAAKLKLTLGATSIAVDRLVKAGYITRTRDESDRRLVWLLATEKAHDVIMELKGKREKLNCSLLSQLSEEEMDQLIPLLHKMIPQK